MPAQQVVQILDAIREVHRRLADRYRELSDATTDDRLQLLLDDMQRREEQFDDCVAQYELNEPPAILHTWLQFVPEEAVKVSDLARKLAAPRTLEELVEETLRLNSTLCDAHLALSREAPIPELRDLFRDLANIEEQNDCHYAKVLFDE